ncbi:MAG: acyl-CoA dehydrogenase family protein [Bradymonadales bacterium]|nr:acyl-CoA dehydrogenase family protein [Bradymonadales bacterium]
MEPYRFVDSFGLSSLLDPEERMTAESVRTWVDQRVMPVIAGHFQDHTFPTYLIPEMGRLGLFGCTLPEAYGCPGLSYMQYGLAMLELERGDSGIRSCSSVQGSLVMYPIFTFGSEQQCRRYLPRLASGELIGCFGLTEPDFGSNPAGMRTRATRDKDGYILNGTKMWITNGSIADLAVVWARTNEGIRGFLVERGTPGFSAPEIKNKMSLRASVTSELVFDDCRLPADSLLPGTTGIKSALMCLNQARYSIAWGALGAAMACYHAALQYAKERIQFGGKPIASHQLVQEKLVTMLTEITKGLLLCLQLGRMMDQQTARHTHISMAKRNNAYWAREIARMARDILGANGITTDYVPIRHMNNLESVYTYEGTHDIHTLILGQEITGIEAFGS